MSSDCRGFTLIEVLLAAVILFSVLGVGMLAYHTAIGTVDRANTRFLLADALPEVRDRIRIELFASRVHQGSGRVNDTVSYHWQAREVGSGKNLLASFDEFGKDYKPGRFTLSLQRIDLTLVCRRSGRESRAHYEYRELVWFH